MRLLRSCRRLASSVAFEFGLRSEASLLGLRSDARRLSFGCQTRLFLASKPTLLCQTSLLLGLRGEASLLLDLCTSTGFCLSLGRETCFLFGSMAGLLLGLRKPARLFGLRHHASLFLGLCNPTSLLGLGRATRFLFSRQASPLLRLRNPPRLLGLRGQASLLLRDPTRLLSLRGQASLLLGLGTTAGCFLGLRCATRVLLGSTACALVGSPPFALGLGGAASPLFDLGGPARFLLGSLPLDLGLCVAACLFLNLGGGGCGGDLLAPLSLLRVDGVALGESFPLLRKLLDPLVRSPFPHHHPRSDYPLEH